MFRLSQFMSQIRHPTPVPTRRPSGPVVIWNLIRRCNLNCRHCYSLSADVDFPGELSTEEIFSVMDDLKSFGVPALILSGGEPLLRPDIFDIAAGARALGFYVGLSTNGTLIDAAMAARIAATGFHYVGISLDGIGRVHDEFRRHSGAFDASMLGVRLCREHGVKVGLRFTMTERNYQSLPAVLDLVEDDAVTKFYLSHLVYSGRGNRYRSDDAVHRTSRWAMDLLFDRAFDHLRRATGKEFVTGNNDADGVYFRHWVRRHFPDAEARISKHLGAWGGNSSGVNIANIDNLGNVHPDTFWWHYSLGNVRQRRFSEIWRDLSDPILAGLRAHPRPVTGRCGACRHLDICNGNTRVRALKMTGDVWAEDPACYLDDHEIGIAPTAATAAMTHQGVRDVAKIF